MKKIAHVLLISLLNLSIAFFSGYLGWTFQFVIIGIIFFSSGMILFGRNHRNNRLRAAILLFPFLISYGFSIFSRNLVHVYPIFFVAVVSVIIAWIVKLRLESTFKLPIIYGTLILLIGFLGMPNWLNYKMDKNTAEDFTFPNINVVDVNGNAFNFEKGKIYVLDLWSLTCRVCIDKFPDFEKLHLKYLKDSEVELYTLCLPLKGKAYNSKFTEKYSFKTLYTTEINSWDELGVREIPKYLVINSNSKIVYMGGLNDKWYHFYNNINTIIKNEKNNQKLPLAIIN